MTQFNVSDLEMTIVVTANRFWQPRVNCTTQSEALQLGLTMAVRPLKRPLSRVVAAEVITRRDNK
jgi:hypothetical protein